MIRFIEDETGGDLVHDDEAGQQLLTLAEKTINVDFIEDQIPRPPRKPRRWPVWLIHSVGVVSLFWNAIGAADYTLSEFRNRAYLAQSAKQLGVSVFDLVIYLGSFPAWAVAAWALGTWGAVTGSLLLLARSRMAVLAFLVSLLGLLGVTVFRHLDVSPSWAAEDGPIQFAIFAVAILLPAYAIFLWRKGLIR